MSDKCDSVTGSQTPMVSKVNEWKMIIVGKEFEYSEMFACSADKAENNHVNCSKRIYLEFYSSDFFTPKEQSLTIIYLYLLILLWYY